MVSSLLNNYATPPIMVSHGKGSWLWDKNGKRYLDFSSGIAVTSLGHCHPLWNLRLKSQIDQLAHASNLYANEPQECLAKAIVSKSGIGKVFFCNSGAEANETLLKLSRLYGKKYRNGAYEVVIAENAFHGRTFGGMSATPQKKIQNGFEPLLPGFITAKYNDLSSFEKCISDRTAAVFIETIQGEGGIYPADLSFLKGLRELCDQRAVLLLIDEVQCGIGRTGAFFAFQHAKIQPDAIGMAKGIAGGFPMGAVWISENYTDLFYTGSHGTTFGGNPLACSAALAVLEIMESENLVSLAFHSGQKLMQALKKLSMFKKSITEIRGKGLMIGIELNIPAAPVVTALRQNGLLTVPAGNNIIRLLPPLNINDDECQLSIDIITEVLE